MSYLVEEDIFSLIEKYLQGLFKETIGVDVATPFAE